MNLLRHTTLASVLFSFLLSSPALTFEAEAARSSTHGEFSTIPNVDQTSAVEWARDRFEAAGLVLPDVHVSFDPTGAACEGAHGRFHANRERRIVLCINEVDTAGLSLMRRRTALHELAHAWDSAHLDVASRETLMKHLGVDVWWDRENTRAWQARGAERLAESFVHALLDQPRRPVMVRLSCHALVSAFQRATSVDPPGPNIPWCLERGGEPGGGERHVRKRETAPGVNRGPSHYLCREGEIRTLDLLLPKQAP